MNINFEALTKGERFIVEWQYHLTGGFMTALADAIRRADGRNLARLAMGFPDEVEAYRNYTGVPGWWEEVQKRAGIIIRQQEGGEGRTEVGHSD